MKAKSLLAGAVLLASWHGAVLAAEDINFSQIAREVANSGQLDQAVTAPTEDVVRQKRAAVLKRLPANQHAAFDAAASSLKERQDKLDYYDRVQQRLSTR